jgi:nucleoside-diphosphate-sugar epimerase
LTRPQRDRERVLVAGAGGAIGAAVCRGLAEDYDVVALPGPGFQKPATGLEHGITWRACEAFSRREVDAALAGCDYVVYLVHTRVATARLDQAACEDMDLLVADNVARAAGRHGVRQIVYLGGVLRRGTVDARHRERRSEVAEALAFYGTPVTTLRAGLIVAPGGSTVRLLAGAATRSRLIVVPKWAMTRRQPIAVTDVVRGIRFCLGNARTFNAEFDVGGPVVVDYGELLRRAARALAKDPIVAVVPWFPARLYAWYLRALSPGSHHALAMLVAEDLSRDIAVRDNPVQAHVSDGAVPPGDLIRAEIRRLGGRLPENPRTSQLAEQTAVLRSARRVRSIQRVTLPPGRDATWVSGHYFGWLSGFAAPFIQCRIDDQGSCDVLSRLPRLSLLRLAFQPDDSSPDRRMYHVTGGLLARREPSGRPRLEFRDVLKGRSTIVAIHDFQPRLPWLFYRATQAVIHMFVMRAFQKHMSRFAARAVSPRTE